jgi:altronate dehydratase small subunit
MMMAPAPNRDASADAIQLSSEDNVATVLRAVNAGETLSIRTGTTQESLLAREAIPLCHKVSLRSIAPGAAILKYGETIGAATTAIAAGTHVHIHNLQSQRGRR